MSGRLSKSQKASWNSRTLSNRNRAAGRDTASGQRNRLVDTGASDNLGSSELANRVRDITRQTNRVLGERGSTQRFAVDNQPEIVAPDISKEPIPVPPKETGPSTVETGQPSPTTVNPQPYTQQPGELSYEQASANLNQNAGGLDANALAMARTSLQNHYRTGYENARASGAPAPSDAGQANTAISRYIPPVNEPIQTSPEVNSFFTQNESLNDSVSQLMEIINPQNQSKELSRQMKKLSKDQEILNEQQMQLMNIKRVMSGTDQDIRDEVTKASGFATESQIQAMTITRNKSLLLQGQLLADQMTNQHNIVENDSNLLQSMKTEANNQFNQRLGLIKYIQDNQKDQRNALQENVKFGINNLGYKGYADSLTSNDAKYAAGVAIGDPGLFFDSARLNAAQTYKDRAAANAASRTIIYNATQGQKLDTADSMGSMLLTGNIPPSLVSAYGGNRNAAIAAADKLSMATTGKHYNAAEAEINYQAAKKFATSLNGPQQVRFKALADSVVNTIDEVGSLADEMANQGIPLANKAKLLAYIQATGADSENGQLAGRYIAAVNTLKEEFANLANGGYAPTESAWRLANTQINENYDVNKLKASLYEVQRLINFRVNAFGNIQPFQMGQNSGTVVMSGPGGTFNVPIDQIDNFINNGYTQN